MIPLWRILTTSFCTKKKWLIIAYQPLFANTLDFSFVDKELINLLPEIESALKYIEFKDVSPFQIEQKDYVSDALPLYN